MEITEPKKQLITKKPVTEEEIIKTYKLILENPPMNNQDYLQNMILVRHGFSQGQEEADFIYKSTGLPNTDTAHYFARTDAKHTDTPLHAIGIKQAINCQKYINTLEFDTVFVSPLYRALQTCYYMYKNHPKKDKIKFIVLPCLSECLNQTQCLANDYHDHIKEFSEKEDKINFDFSHLLNMEHKGLFWQLDQVVGREEHIQEIKKKIMDEIGDQEITDKNFGNFHKNIYQKIMYDYIKEHFCTHSILENRKMVFNRVNQQFKPFLRKFFEEKKPTKKIGVVSHYVTLNTFTRKNFEDLGKPFYNATLNYYNFN